MNTPGVATKKLTPYCQKTTNIFDHPTSTITGSLTGRAGRASNEAFIKSEQTCWVPPQTPGEQAKLAGPARSAPHYFRLHDTCHMHDSANVNAILFSHHVQLVLSHHYTRSLTPLQQHHGKRRPPAAEDTHICSEAVLTLLL